MAVATNEIWVANLIEFWREDNTGASVSDFCAINGAAEMGKSNPKGKTG